MATWPRAHSQSVSVAANQSTRTGAERPSLWASAPAVSQKSASSSGMPNSGSGMSGQCPVFPVTSDSDIHHSDARNQPKPAAPAIRQASPSEAARPSCSAGRDSAAINGTSPKGGSAKEATRAGQRRHGGKLIVMTASTDQMTLFQSPVVGGWRVTPRILNSDRRLGSPSITSNCSPDG